MKIFERLFSEAAVSFPLRLNYLILYFDIPEPYFLAMVLEHNQSIGRLAKTRVVFVLALHDQFVQFRRPHFIFHYFAAIDPLLNMLTRYKQLTGIVLPTGFSFLLVGMIKSYKDPAERIGALSLKPMSSSSCISKLSSQLGLLPFPD